MVRLGKTARGALGTRGPPRQDTGLCHGSRKSPRRLASQAAQWRDPERSQPCPPAGLRGRPALTAEARAGHKASLSLGRRPPGPDGKPEPLRAVGTGQTASEQHALRTRRASSPLSPRPRPRSATARGALGPAHCAATPWGGPGAGGSILLQQETRHVAYVGQEPGLRPRVWGARCSDSQREAAWPPHLSSSRLQHGNGLVAHRASRAGGCRAGVPRRRGAAGRGAWRAPPHPGGAAGLPSRSSCCPHVPTLRLLRKGKGEAASV